MKLKVINIDGKKVNDIEISDKIFSLKPNKYLIQSLIVFKALLLMMNMNLNF